MSSSSWEDSSCASCAYSSSPDTDRSGSSTSSSASSVGRRIMEELIKVRRKLTFASCTFEDKRTDDQRTAAGAKWEDEGNGAGHFGLSSTVATATATEAAGLEPVGAEKVGCEYNMSKEQVRQQQRAAESPAGLQDEYGLQHMLQKPESLSGAVFCSNTLSSGEGSAAGSQQAKNRAAPDWANGLPPDFIEQLACCLRDSCTTEWHSVQNVYNAASVCRRWRDAIQRACFHRSPQQQQQQQRKPVRRVKKKKSLVDGMLCHPDQLIEREATEEDVIHCSIVREKSKGPFSYSKYKLILGADYSKAGKTLLVAHHQLLATKSAYNIFLSSNQSQGYTSAKRLGQLHSSPYGTLFELYSAKKMKSGSVRRTKSGNIKYSFNMLGGRGPRSLQVSLPDEEADQQEQRQSSSPRIRRARSSSSLSSSEEGETTILENKLPRWHELLQCWCLDFGGRVKCASVKNFQLVSRDDPEEIVLQFGKVDSDLFTMDFRPKLLSAQQAFMICLSSFDSKLSCF